MTGLYIVIGVIVSAIGTLLALSCILTLALNIILNKHLPFYKDLLLWAKHRRKFKEWLKEKSE